MSEQNPWALLAGIARAEVGIREDSRNDGPRIRQYWRACGENRTGWKERLPWCAVFVAWCIARASEADERLRLSNPCRSASVNTWVEWAEKNATRVNIGIAEPGCIVTFLPAFSHIGIVFEHGPGLILTTCEGNTDGSGGRDGDGVYLRERAPIFPVNGSIWRLPCRALPVRS